MKWTAAHRPHVQRDRGFHHRRQRGARARRDVTVDAAASGAGIQVPKLCATDSLEPFGSCRLCLVEIDGRKGTPHPARPLQISGMVVHTKTPAANCVKGVDGASAISDHPLDCSPAAPTVTVSCEDMAGVTGLRNVRYA
ncbi:2Fe-2S iron-sulfur cluster-binding protein [Candidatus Aalborgicola defluviihabitans]|uniref:2Fe-2S iron-sulfur cluster-binding protein n=1 Tax=Candidatus Aalborgicola defluviihabitans TaxID=3386187 RepID=UPI0039B84EF7